MGNLPLLNATVEFADVISAANMLLKPDRHKNGLYIREFEELFANYVGVKHAYSFLGGRVSLSAILQALDLGEGDEVILPAYNCVVVPNALYYKGIKCVYADIDSSTFNILPRQIDKLVTPQTRAVIIQHIFGIVADLELILSAADRHGLIVIEDCAHALGAEYRKKKVGTFGKAAFFSTEQSKVISTQMGGMAVTNDDLLGEKIRKIQETSPFPSSEEIKQRLWQFVANYFATRPYYNDFWGPFFTQVVRPLFGVTEIPSTPDSEVCSVCPHDYGKRLPNALAFLGIRQLKEIDKYNKRRLDNAMMYTRLLQCMGAKTVPISNHSKPIFLRYPIYVREKKEFQKIAREIGLQPGIWFTDVIHPQGVSWTKLGYVAGRCPNAERLVKSVANLPTGRRLRSNIVKRFSLMSNVVTRHTNIL